MEKYPQDDKEMRILIDCIKNLSSNDSFINMRKYIQHGQTDCLFHCIAVAYFSYATAAFLKLTLDQMCLVKGAMLHDFFLYDWHEPDSAHKLHGFTHPKAALKNAMQIWELSDIEKDIIIKHMFPLVPNLPRYKESILVCIIDKICSVMEILFLPSSNKVSYLYDYALKNNMEIKGVRNGKDDQGEYEKCRYS